MAANPIFLAALVVGEGGAVAWAAWELWKVRPNKPDKTGEGSAFSRAPASSDLPEPPGHSEGEHGPDHG